MTSSSNDLTISKATKRHQADTRDLEDSPGGDHCRMVETYVLMEEILCLGVENSDLWGWNMNRMDEHMGLIWVSMGFFASIFV